MLRRLQHLSCEEKLREMGLLSLEKTQLHGKLIEAFNTYKTTKKLEPGSVWKCRVAGQDTAVTNFTEKVLTACKEKYFSMGAVKNRNRSPRQVVKSPPLGDLLCSTDQHMMPPKLLQNEQFCDSVTAAGSFEACAHSSSEDEKRGHGGGFLPQVLSGTV